MNKYTLNGFLTINFFIIQLSEKKVNKYMQQILKHLTIAKKLSVRNSKKLIIN